MEDKPAVKIRARLVQSSLAIKEKHDELSLMELIEQQLKGLDVSAVKLDPSFIQYIASLIENQCQKHSQGEKPNKLQIFEDILKRLFPSIQQSEVDVAKQILHFLLKNKMVKKVPLSRVITYFLKKDFSK
jgi:hypothetical protein